MQADEPLGRSLVRLVAPMFLGMAMIALVGVVNAYFIGMLGTEALAAFGLSYPAVMIMQALMFGLSNGVTATMARARGRRALEPIGAEERLRMKVSIQMGVALAAVLALLGALLGPVLFRRMSTPSVARLALEYYGPYLVSLLLMAVPMAITASLRGLGETRSSATVMTLSSLLSAGLAPLLMFGFGPVPPLGMAGASIASVIAYAVGASYAIVLAARALRGASRGAVEGLRPGDVMREVAGIGGPAMLTQALGPVASATIATMVAGFGATALAGLGIIQRIDMLLLMVPVATGAGLMPLVGQLTGSGNPRRAAEALRLARRAVLGFGVTMGLALNALVGPIASLFTDEAEVAHVVRLALLFTPISYVSAGLNITTMSAFNAVGHPMLATKLSALFSLVLLPLGTLVLGKLFGVIGVFGGATTAGVVSAWLGTRWMAGAGLTVKPS